MARFGIIGRAAHAVMVAVTTFLVGLVTACAGMAMFTCLLLVWTDLLHDNPHRTVANALVMMLLSPLYGMVLGIGLFGLALAAGGVFTGLWTMVRRLPSPAGMAIVAAASVVAFVRWCYSSAEAVAESADWRQDSPPWLTLVGGAMLLTASLYAGWYVAGRLNPRDR